MTDHHFISYSSVDAADFALRLCDELTAGPPPIAAWLDKRQIKPGQDWDDQIVEAIRTCESLIFIMTPDSVESESVCKNEWTRAIKYKKALVPVLLHQEVDIPFQIGNRQYIDFTGDYEIALAKLRNHLTWLKSSEGKLQALKDRLADATRDLRRTDDPVKQQHIQDDIRTLKKQIETQEQVVANPKKVERWVQENIERGLERERTPKKRTTGIVKSNFINMPPGVAPTYFQNRFVETKLVGDFLKNEAERLLTIVGRGGIGKTAMVCRLLKSLESGHLPDEGGDLSLDGIVYLSESGSRKVTFANLFADLCQLLPEETARELEAIYKDAKTNTVQQTQALLKAFPRGKYVVLLDNFEDKIDPETRDIHDEELNEALTTFLTAEHHAIKLIITTRIAPRSLALTEPGRQRPPLYLDEGLGSPYAENILREMDKDGKVGLKDAPDALLSQARQRTMGYPRALEALFAILSADRDTTLQDILADAEKMLPNHVVEKLVGEAFSRLDPNAQQVMQALAIYGHPVTNTAVDFLLQPYLPGMDSAPILSRLVNMNFVRKEGGRYYLHPVDREYALSHVPKGEISDKFQDAVFSQYALRYRGAEFFKSTRLPRQDWKALEDLAAQLSEFELRYEGEDYDTATSLLLEIDFNYLMLWGHYRLVLQLHERLKGKIKEPSLARASVGNLGTAYYYIGQYTPAFAYYEQALKIARQTGDRDDEGTWLGNLGNCYSETGEVARAIEHYEQALKIARETGNLGNEGNWLGCLGICYKDSGDTQRAIDLYNQALNIALKVGERRSEGTWLGNLGSCYQNLGDVQRAIDLYNQALNIAVEIGDLGNEGSWLGSLGSCYRDSGDSRLALDYYQQALKIAIEIGDRRNEGNWLGNLGNCYDDIGDIQHALKCYQQALDIALEIGDRRNEGNWLGCLGNSYSYLGDTHRAIDYNTQALKIAREIGDRRNEIIWLINVGAGYHDLGEIPLASDHYRQSLQIAKEIDDPLGIMANITNLGTVYIEQGKFDEAKKEFYQAIDIADRIENMQFRNEARYFLALTFFYTNDFLQASKVLKEAQSLQYPPTEHVEWVLRGLISISQGDRQGAQEAFTKGLTETEAMIKRSELNYKALYSRGFSLCGLVLLKKEQDLLEEAKNTYRQACAINKDPGYIRGILRLFDKLAEHDADQMLQEVRNIISAP